MKKEIIEKIAEEILGIRKEALKYNKDTLAVYGLIDANDAWGNLGEFGIDHAPKNKKDKFNVSNQISKNVGIAGAMRSMY